MAIQGILVDVDYCTGCEACVLACQQEHGYSEKEFGIKITKLGPLHIDEANKVFQYDFIPQFTQWCDLCEERCGKGKKPTCVQHAQAQCLDWGPIEELACQGRLAQADDRRHQRGVDHTKAFSAGGRRHSRLSLAQAEERREGEGGVHDSAICR